MAKRNEKTVLFLCTGNDYRSRFAEILFNSVAMRMALPWRATSKGLAIDHSINNIGAMASSAITALYAMGIRPGDAATRVPVQVTSDDFMQADRIVALKQVEHLPLLQERFPTWSDKVEYWHVDDALIVLPIIEREVMAFISRILGGGEHPREPAIEAPMPIERPKKPVIVKVGRETAGRRGKGVTTVFDIPLDDDGINQLATTLKQRCGTGGTFKDGRIEIQGDQRERIVVELEKLGYKVKRVGG